MYYYLTIAIKATAKHRRITWCKMLSLKGLSFYSCLIVLTAGAAVKVPPEAAWMNPAYKFVYSRALGPPPSGMDTISVPYMPKSPLFPKFVDPKTMISKKTDLLSNLFGGLGPAYPMGFKPFMPYAASGSTFYNTADGAQLLSGSSKSNVDDGSSLYKRGIFGPFSSTPFGSMGPKFGPMSPFSGLNTAPDYSMKGDFSRKRRSIDESMKLRSIMDTGKPETKDLGPPPPYPTLAPIPEEPEDAMGSVTGPKEYLPGMFGPFGPFGPVVDPSMFISKKSTFLDTLFKNLATSTPAPTSTEASTPKSTIVPPDFWFPASMIPSPTEYSQKVSDFLDKLFDSLKLNKTMAATDSESTTAKYDFMRSVKSNEDITQAKVARSIDDLSSINAAKDTIVNSILSELSDLKSSMVTNMNDLITYEKSSAATSAKKPFKPFAPGPWSKPTIDGTLPFQQKMTILSQVFDMLSDLQKNITLAVQNTIKAKMTSAGTSDAAINANYPPMANNIISATDGMPINMSLLDVIKSKLGSFDYEMPISYTSTFDNFGPKIVRTLPKTPASFWVSYPEDASATVKRHVESDDTQSLINEDSNFDRKQQTRGVKMQMHQGYQSLPAGSIESVQAGGGSVPGHQGGGIKLLDASNYEDINNWINWMEYLRNDNQGHRHHNHH